MTKEQDELLYQTDVQEVQSAELSDEIKSMNTGQRWASLKKSWVGFTISLRENNETKAIEYAKRINMLQKSLNLDVGVFEIRKNKEGIIYNARSAKHIVAVARQH